MVYHMTIAGLERDLPICKVTDSLYIAGFVIFGDQELTVACARELLKIAPEYDYLITAEAKGIPLIHEMARQSGAKKYFIARKGQKGVSDMRNYKNYIKLTDSADLAIFRQDTKFIEERHSLQLDNLKLKQSKQLTLLICFISIIVLASTVVYIYNRLKITSLEKKNFSLLCGQLITEKNMLLQTLEAKWVVNSSVKDVILKRLELLNSFIATLFSRNDVIDKESKQFLMMQQKMHLNSRLVIFIA